MSRVLGRGVAALISAVPKPDDGGEDVNSDLSTPPSTSAPLVLDRTRRRRAIEIASRRPSPGTSDLLSVPMSQEITGHIGKGCITYDVVRLAPIHLIGGIVDREIKERGKK